MVSRRDKRSVMKRNPETQFNTSSVVFSLSTPILATYSIHAYIDAGTVSLIIQFLIAGAVGGLFLIKVSWKKVKAFFGNLFAKVRRGTK